ncbi:MAG: hypothetical protein WC661_06955 [Opitutaceae bacterium]|jgi:hypothetical protein
MKHSSPLILSVFFACSPLTASPDVATFDNSEIAMPELTIGKKPETPEEKLIRKQFTAPRDDFTYWSSFTYWSKHMDIAGLPAALNALDKEWGDLSTRKADSTRDITYAEKALSTLTSYYVKISKINPEEAERLIQYINEKLKPLKEEFHPELPYRSAYVNPPPNVSFEEIYSNAIYNNRQRELRSFFLRLKRIKRHYPELQGLDEMGDLLVDERFPTIKNPRSPTSSYRQ